MAPTPKRKRGYTYREKYSVQFGLRVVARSPTGVVEDCVCRFCECWGREGDNDAGRKRKRTANVKHWKTVFRTDNIRKHMLEQHRRKFDQYQALRERDDVSPAVLLQFFEQAKETVCFEKRIPISVRSRTFTIDASIVEVALNKCLMPLLRNDSAEGGSEAVFKGEYVTQGDGSIKLACFKATLNNPEHINQIVSLLACGLNFYQVSQVMMENHENLDREAIIGSAAQVFRVSRIVCAVALQSIADLIKKSWAFAVSCDISEDNFGNSYIHVRLQFPGVYASDDLLSFHLMAIPLFLESPRSDETLFELFSQVLDALCPLWKDKLIGSSINGALSQLATNVGFTKMIAKASNCERFYSNWCLFIDLDGIVCAALHALADGAHFSFFSVLSNMVGWLRCQDDFVRRLGAKCPYLVDDKWTSVFVVLNWLLGGNRTAVVEFMREKHYTCGPRDEWWLMAMIVFHFLKVVSLTRRALQVQYSSASKQYDDLDKLLTHLQQEISAERDEERSLDLPTTWSSSVVCQGQFVVDIGKTAAFVQGIGVAAAELCAQFDSVVMQRVLAASAALYLEAMNGLARAMASRQAAISAADDHLSSAPPPCFPLDLIDTSAVDFVALVSSHKAQLRKSFDEEFLQLVCDQHKALIRAYSDEPRLQEQLVAGKISGFRHAWSACGSRFSQLQMFCAGLATVRESNVQHRAPLMSSRRNYCRSATPDAALESVMFAKQFDALQQVAVQLYNSD